MPTRSALVQLVLFFVGGGVLGAVLVVKNWNPQDGDSVFYLITGTMLLIGVAVFIVATIVHQRKR